MKRFILFFFMGLPLFTGCSTADKRVGATVIRHELAGIDIERKTNKIKLHTPRIFWQGKDPDKYNKTDIQKIKILKEAFNQEIADAGYFEVSERSSQGSEFVDITLTIDHFHVQLKKEDGIFERSGSISCSLKVIDEGDLLGGSTDSYTENVEYQRASSIAADLAGSIEAMKTLAKDVTKLLAQEISPSKQNVFREFEKGGTKDNSHGVDAAMNGNWEAALRLWSEAIHQCNSCPQAYFNKAIFYEMGGETKQAQRFYSIAFELSPKNDKYSKIKGEIDHEIRIMKKYKQMNAKKKKNKHDTGGF